MNTYRSECLRYLKHFKIPFIITVVVLTIFVSVYSTHKRSYYESPNTERVYGSRRVFDYGDQLTDAEERNLEEYIRAAEKETCVDIVIVTLNESLKDYAPEYKAGYSMQITPDKYVMVYADKFWEDNRFGYDQPQILNGKTNSGDGVLLLDNVYREEETGKIYTWMCTTGICQRKYTSSMIDRALDVFYTYVDTDYYLACTKFVDVIVHDMGIKKPGFKLWPVIVALIVLAVYYSANRKVKAAAVTVNERTYLVNGSEMFDVKGDIFIRKAVTKRYNPPQSSSGGGGGHTSGGGGSHGGGGHSR